MTIGFDARLMSVPGGIPRYCRELLVAMTAATPHNNFVVLVKKIPTDFPVRDNIRWAETDIHWYTCREQLQLGRLMNAQADVDLWHIPHWNVPLTLRRPFVMTIHDFIFEDFPTHDRTMRGRLLFAVRHAAWRLIIRCAVKRARAIMTVSHFVAGQIAQRFPVAAPKISVTHLGVSSFPTAVQPREKIEQPFFLLVGNSYPHKNHALVFDMVAAHPELNAHWYIVTHRDRFSEAARTAIAARGLSDRIHFLFDAPDAHVAWLYSHAAALVHPSRAEGFGIPILEAFSFGTPVIAAHTSSLPEIAGDLAHWISPDAPDDLGAAAQKILQNHEQTDDFELRKQRIAHAARFTWAATALSTQKIYESVL